LPRRRRCGKVAAARIGRADRGRIGGAMKDAERVLFAGGGLDRAAHLRGDAAALAGLAARADARALALWRGKALMAVADGEAAPEGARLGWLAPDHPVIAGHGGERVFLGLVEGAPRWAVDVSAWEDPAEDREAPGRFADTSLNRHPALAGHAFVDLRAHLAALDPAEAGVAAAAKGILGWHAAHRFCARCGAGSAPAEAGWKRACPACGAQHFPRTDPVVIMLVTRRNRVLLGRQPGWPPAMHSLLAGFMEPGESIEGAVRRETFEEAGIAVGAVHYLSSQPWPFPSSLMIGCRAEALDEEIRRDPAELEAARWATREEVLAGMTGRDPDLKPARKGAIARFLLERWLADDLE
jgi:NAD+ diphosphatase